MIKVKKEIAERLNYMKSDHRYSNDSILRQHSEGWSQSENQCLNDLSLSQLAKCLLLGYEVELTNEQQILQQYNIVMKMKQIGLHEKGYVSGYQDGVSLTLHHLGIKIEGINA